MAGAPGTSYPFSITFEIMPRIVLFRMTYLTDLDYCYLYINDGYDPKYSIYTGRPDLNGIAYLENVKIEGQTISGYIHGQGDCALDAEYLAIYS